MDLVTWLKLHGFGFERLHGVPVNEYVHKSSYLPLIVHNALPKSGILRVQAAKNIRKRVAWQPHNVLPPGVFLEGPRQDDLNESLPFIHVLTRLAGPIKLFRAWAGSFRPTRPRPRRGETLPSRPSRCGTRHP